MDKVTVDLAELKATVEHNRGSHRELFDEALEGYRKQALERLEEYVAELRRGATPQIRIGLVVPEDHTKDYDQIIKMLEMSVDSQVELTHQEFAQYVMDDWGWKQQWTASNSVYYAD